MTDVSKAMALLHLGEKWLESFDVIVKACWPRMSRMGTNRMIPLGLTL